MIDMTLAAGKHLVATLKENQPELLSEARALLSSEAPECFDQPKAPGKSGRQVTLRQADGFTTETIHTPLRNLQPALRRDHTVIYFAALTKSANLAPAPVFDGELPVIEPGSSSINDLFSQGGKLLKTIGAGLLMYLVILVAAIPRSIVFAVLGGFSNMDGSGPSGISIFIGLLAIYIPMILISVRLSFFITCIVDQDCGAVDSLKQSRAITQNNYWVIIGRGIVAPLINMAGMLALIIGLIVTLPVTYLMFLTAYRWLRHGFRSCDLT